MGSDSHGITELLLGEIVLAKQCGAADLKRPRCSGLLGPEHSTRKEFESEWAYDLSCENGCTSYDGQLVDDAFSMPRVIREERNVGLEIGYRNRF